MPYSISSVSSSSIASGLGMTNIWLLSIARASLRYSSACGQAGFALDDRLAVDLGPLHVVVAGHEMDHLRAQTGGRAPRSFRFSLSTLRLLQINPPRRTPPASANFTMPLQMLLAAYMAIISPEQTM